MDIAIFIWTLVWTLASHLHETYFLFKNLSSEVWRLSERWEYFALMGFFKNHENFKMTFFIHHCNSKPKKLFILYNFLLKVVHTIKLSFSILRELNKFLPRAFCLFNIGWCQRRSYSLLSDSRKRKTKSPRNEVGS